MGRCAERARHGRREQISPSFKLHYPASYKRYTWLCTSFYGVISLRSNGLSWFILNASIVLDRLALSANRGVSTVDTMGYFPSASDSCENFARTLRGWSALSRRLLKNKNRPLGYVNMADENLLSRSRSTAASRPRVTPGNKERAAF